MRYELDLIHELCQELGFHSWIRSSERLEIKLEKEIFLVFQNAERDEDCLVCFDGTPWHTHNNFIFADSRGYNAEMNYLDVVTALKDGLVLLCESWHVGQLTDRWLIHRDYNDELRYIDKGEEIRVRRMLTAG